MKTIKWVFSLLLAASLLAGCSSGQGNEVVNSETTETTEPSEVTTESTSETTEVTTEASKETTEATEATTEATETTTEATQPTTKPSGGNNGGGTTKPTEPKVTEPKETEATNPTTKPTEPKETQPKPTEPKETQPKPTEPKETQPKPTEPKETDPPTEPTTEATEPPAEVIDTAALESYGRSYASSAYGYEGTTAINSSNSSYYSPSLRLIYTMDEGYAYVRSEVDAQYSSDIASGRSPTMEFEGQTLRARLNVDVVSTGNPNEYWIYVFYG